MVMVMGVVVVLVVVGVLVRPGAGTGFFEKKLEKSFKRREEIFLVRISRGKAAENLLILNVCAIKARRAVAG